MVIFVIEQKNHILPIISDYLWAFSCSADCAASSLECSRVSERTTTNSAKISFRPYPGHYRARGKGSNQQHRRREGEEQKQPTSGGSRSGRGEINRSRSEYILFLCPLKAPANINTTYDCRTMFMIMLLSPIVQRVNSNELGSEDIL